MGLSQFALTWGSRKTSATAGDQTFCMKKSNNLLEIARAETNLELSVSWVQNLRQTGFAIRFGQFPTCLWGPKVALAAGGWLRSLFREPQLDAKGATSPEDPSDKQEAWHKLKTWFAWVQTFNQGSL
jgi:hypothetical protein